VHQRTDDIGFGGALFEDSHCANVVLRNKGKHMSWNPWSSVLEGRAAPGSSVTALSIGGNRFALFLADPNGGVYTASGNTDQGWSPWSSVSEGHAAPGSSVTALSIGGNRFALFLADPNGGVYTASGNTEQGWGQWSSVSAGRAAPGSSVTAVPIGGNRFALFVADSLGGVFTTSGSANGWLPWTPVSEGRTAPGSSVTAVAIGGGRFALFLADPNGGIYTTSGNTEHWGPWSSVSAGRAAPGSPVTAVPIGGDGFALFIADPLGGVFTTSGNPNGWLPWSPVSEGRTAPGSSVTAVAIGGGRFALFLADPNGGVYTTSGNTERGWDIWSSVSEGRAAPGSAVTAVPMAGNQFALFVVDPLGGVFATSGDSSSPIKHVFVLMLENRSFDHMLGFSGITGTDATTGQPTTIDGLKGTESNSFEGRTHTVATGAADVMSTGPGHEFGDVLEQLCGPNARYPSGGAYPAIDNSGFVSSYAKRVGSESAGDVMKCFSASQLPVLNALAREFVVCDRWFSSMPGPTEPNRMFAHAATCGDFDDSPTRDEIIGAIASPGGGFEFRHGTVFRLLEKAGVKYRIYADDHTPVAAELDGISVVFDIREFEDFAKDLQNPSFDAGYVHIEPSYDVLDHFEDGNSQHPNGSVAAGERFIKATYEAIRSSPVWNNSLLIITWDEHGGFYDHVPPGRAERTGERGRTHGFTFDQLGPRVPAVIVSPLIRGNLIEHKPFDHTAIPATLSRVFRLPSLGARNGISGGVDHLVGVVFRSDAPMKLPDVASSGIMAWRHPSAKVAPRRPDALLADDPHGNLATMLHSVVVQHLQVTPEEQHAAILARVRLLTTHADAFAYLKEVEQLVQTKRAQAGFAVPLIRTPEGVRPVA
jgi:phospholipase C